MRSSHPSPPLWTPPLRFRRVEAPGFSPDTAANLDELATDFELQEGKQGTALSDRVGATATIPATLRAGTSAVKTLNVIFRRIYKGNLEVFTAWKTVSLETEMEPRMNTDSHG